MASAASSSCGGRCRRYGQRCGSAPGPLTFLLVSSARDGSRSTWLALFQLASSAWSFRYW
jgi:hypothetical protein